MRQLWAVIAHAALAGTLAACGPDDLPVPPTVAERFPAMQGERLTLGREIWLGTCKGCHADGVAGAPVAGDVEQWDRRATQGCALLKRHAIDGFFGPQYTQMPARGGNPALSDEQVGLAVEYMLALAGITEECTDES